MISTHNPWLVCYYHFERLMHSGTCQIVPSSFEKLSVYRRLNYIKRTRVVFNFVQKLSVSCCDRQLLNSMETLNIFVLYWIRCGIFGYDITTIKLNYILYSKQSLFYLRVKMLVVNKEIKESNYYVIKILGGTIFPLPLFCKVHIFRIVVDAL